MTSCQKTFQDFQELRQYVAETLSAVESLQPDQFPLTQHVLKRGGSPCGMYFCLHGPRDVRLTAIWETDKDTILFYGSRGERMLRTELSSGVPCYESFSPVAVG